MQPKEEVQKENLATIPKKKKHLGRGDRDRTRCKIGKGTKMQKQCVRSKVVARKVAPARSARAVERQVVRKQARKARLKELSINSKFSKEKGKCEGRIWRETAQMSVWTQWRRLMIAWYKTGDGHFFRGRKSSTDLGGSRPPSKSSDG